MGGYIQPYKETQGSRVTIAGSDWDLGTRTRKLGQKIGYVDIGVETSERRAAVDIRDYITGVAYEGAFIPFRNVDSCEDIDRGELPKLAYAMKLRATKHYAMKVVLVDQGLLNNSAVKAILGNNLMSDIRNWISKNGVVDINVDRNGFIYGTLDDIHAQYGDRMTQLLVGIGA